MLNNIRMAVFWWLFRYLIRLVPVEDPEGRRLLVMIRDFYSTALVDVRR